MLAVVKNLLLRYQHRRSFAKRFTRIEVPVVFREGAGGDLNPYPMTFLKELAGVPKINVIGVNSPRLD